MAGPETVTEHDVTEDVRHFFDLPLEWGEGQTAVVEGLELVAVNGLVRASRHVRDFDGCHPYEYDSHQQADRFAVDFLAIQKYGKVITTEAGHVATDDDSLANYRFVIKQHEARQPNTAELELQERLATAPFLARVNSDQLVGYRNQLLVSAKDPLRHPFSIPAKRDYDEALPLHRMTVDDVSVHETDAGQQAALTLRQYSYDRPTRLTGLPLDQLDFTIEPLKNQPRVVLSRALAAAALSPYGQISAETSQTIEAFNDLPDLDGYRMHPQFWRNNRYGWEIPATIARLEDDNIVEARPAQKADVQAYRVDRLLVEPASKQLFLADLAAGIALDAASIMVDETRWVDDHVRMINY